MSSGIIEDSSRSRTAISFIRRLKHILWYFYVGVCLVGLIWFSKSIWLPWLYTYLNVGQPPQQADYAVVLSGYCRTRTETAADLYANAYVSNIVVSGSRRCLESSLEVLDEAGVPSTAVSLISPPGGSTWSEAEKVLAFLEETGADSALIVTHGYHSRRVRWTYQRRARNQGIGLAVVVTPHESFPTSQWWQTKLGRLYVRREYTKLIFYHLYYGTFAHKVMPPGRAILIRRSVCRHLPATMCDLT